MSENNLFAALLMQPVLCTQNGWVNLLNYLLHWAHNVAFTQPGSVAIKESQYRQWTALIAQQGGRGHEHVRGTSHPFTLLLTFHTLTVTLSQTSTLSNCKELELFYTSVNKNLPFKDSLIKGSLNT